MKTTRSVKAAVGLVGLAIAVGLVMNWVGDYREASKSAGAKQKKVEATSAAPSEEEPAQQPAEAADQQPAEAADQQPAEAADQQPETETVLIVAVDGLNFRAEPTAKAKAIRGLSQGERIVLLADQGDWLKVRDAKKVVGYITSDPAYTDPE